MLQARQLYLNGFVKFGTATLGLIFAPFVLSFFLDFAFTTLNALSKGTFQFGKFKKTLFKALGHLPFVQVYSHGKYLYNLWKGHCRKSQAIIGYQDLDVSHQTVFGLQKEERLKLKEQVDECAKKYKDSCDSYQRFYCKFQEQQLIDKFGQDGPQFALQLGLILIFGYISVLQIFTIFTSFCGFAFGSVNIYTLLPTKYSDIRFKNWQDSVVLAFCFMFIIIPRVFSLCLIIVYLKSTVFLALLAYFVLAIFILWLMKRDIVENEPKNTVLGVLTNIFSPCIVINEYDNFLLISSMIGTISHLLMQIALFLLVYTQTFQPLPTSDPPILHCYFDSKIIEDTSSRLLERCSFTYINDTLTKNQDCVPLFSALSDAENHITFCQPSMNQWEPLLLTSLTVGFFLMLNIPITIFLQWYLCPIRRFQVSRKIFHCFEPNFKREHKFMVPILDKLFEDKSKKNYMRQNQDLMSKINGMSLLHWSIEQKYFLFSQSLLEDFNADISEDDWIAVCQTQSIEGLNILVNEIERRTESGNEFLQDAEIPLQLPSWKRSLFNEANAIAAQAKSNFEHNKKIKGQSRFWTKLEELYSELDKLENESSSSTVQDDELDRISVPSCILYDLQRHADLSPKDGVVVSQVLNLNSANIWLMEQGEIGVRTGPRLSLIRRFFNERMSHFVLPQNN